MFPPIKSIQIQSCKKELVLQDNGEKIYALLHTGKTGFGHRFSIIAKKPFLLIEQKAGQGTFLLSAEGKWKNVKNAWTVLQNALQKYRPKALTKKNLPFTSGAIVALSYDIFGKRYELENPAPFSGMLWACFFLEYEIFDRVNGKYWQIKLNGPDELDASLIPATKPWAGVSFGMKAENYKTGVRQIKNFIRQGRIYQVNLTRQFQRATALSPFSLFQKLNAQNPAPMSGLFRINDRALISSSPERFLKHCNGRLESNPIKGTRPRTYNFERNREMLRELWTSEKENAELAMIVDLMRNDLGRHACEGSVRVSTRRRIENYSNVFHLVARIEAGLKPGTNPLSVIRDAWPPGSVTGCPKIESMMVIDTLETGPRGFYTGAMGYVDFNGNFDLNVMIRTLHYRQGMVRFGLGSGIVFDSVPQAEFDETRDKGQTIFRILG